MFAQILLKSSYQNYGLLVRTITCQVFSLTLTVRGVSNKHCLLTFFILPARPASQTHDSHKGRMIFNHESPAGRIKNCGEKSALSF